MKNELDYITEQSSWHSKSLQGCLYAAYALGKDNIDIGIKKVVLTKEASINLLNEVSSIINENIKDESNSIISFILPSIKSLSDLLLFVQYSKEISSWSVHDTDIYNNMKLVKIRVHLNVTNESEDPIYSWMLGFGPFDFFPRTRISPFFEIIVPTKSKLFLMNKYNRHTLTKQNEDSIDRGGTLKDAHLADIFIENITNETKVDNSMWNNTIKRKYKILTDSGNVDFNDTNAKAKITFSCPVYG